MLPRGLSAKSARSYLLERDLQAVQQESVCLSVARSTRIEEAFVKTMKYFCLAVLAFSLLAIPAAAQKSRSNKDGANHGDARADLVQSENKKKDKDRDPNPDNDKNKGKHTGETKGKHTAKGHRH